MERIYMLSCSVGFLYKWHAHQITTAALYPLLHKAYSSYVEEHDDHAGNFDVWRQLKEDENLQFLEFDTRDPVLVFVIIKRRGFHLYIQTLWKKAPLMFAHDDPNYAGWLPVHRCDMMLLEECRPDVAAEFRKGEKSACLLWNITWSCPRTKQQACQWRW